VVVSKRVCRSVFAVIHKACSPIEKRPRRQEPQPFDAHSLEVFSPDRIGAEVRKQGLRSAGHFDLQTGWDFRDPGAKARVRKSIVETRPWMVFLSPVCTAFSQMQRSAGASPEKRKAGLKLGLDMMRFCVEVAKQQESEGRKFVLEQPAWASCWDMEPLWSLARSKHVFLVYMDQCQVGLAVGSFGLNKKPTKFLTNCELMARVLAGKVCTGGHEHERLQSGLPKLAQE
jgi:hypothetical protein